MRTFLLVFALTSINIPFMLVKIAPFESEMDKGRKLKIFEAYALMLAVVATVTAVMSMTIGVDTYFYKIIPLAIGFISTLANILIIKNRVYEHLFVMGLSASTVFFVYSTVTFIQVKVMHTTDDTLFLMVNAFACTAMSIPFIPFFRKMVTGIVTPFFPLDAKEFWRQVWFIPETLFIVTFIAVPTGKYITTASALISRLLIMGVTLAVCHTISRENLNIRAKHESEEQLARQQEYYHALSDSVTTMRKYRHDFKHHLAALNGFADAGQFDEMKDYLKEMSLTSDKETVVHYTGRASADGLIYHYASVADQEKIDLKVKGTFKDISITDTDLCVLLGNALENAVGGCRTISEGRFISIETKRQGGLFAILVKNSFDGTVNEEEGKILSRKRNKSKGIGLTSMEDICKKYKGTFEQRHDGNVFSVFLMLDCVEA